MSFLNPALLAFAAAAAVPILIHLLNRRKFRQVSWAAMRFVRASLEKNRRRMQLEDLILLALRCLLVLLLALALARPALRSAAAFLESDRGVAVIVLDHSASLGASDGTRTRWDQARQAAEAVVDTFPAGSAAAVLLAGDSVTPLIPEPAYDLNFVRKAIREAPASDLGTDHSVGIAAALEVLATQTSLRKEIFLVTDRQAVGWKRLPEIRAQIAAAGRDVRLRVVLVGESLEDNLAVVSLVRAAGFASVREPLRFQAEIANRGFQAVRQVRATLHVDGGSASDEAVLDVLPPGESRRVTLFARVSTPGYHTVGVRLPPDRLPADDERTVVVRAVDEVRVAVVDGDPTGNAAFFLRNALQPVAPEAAATYFLQPRLVSPGQLGLMRFSDLDAVVLADVAPLPGPAVDNLARYVRDGGALVIFPGPQARAAFYNEELLARAGLLPAALGGLRGSTNGVLDGETFGLQASGYDHPVFALWNESGSGALAGARFRAAWTLSPVPASTNAASGEISAAGSVMLRFADGRPAAVERTVGRGRVMLFASTAGTAWNDLAVRPAFVPVLHRSIAWLGDAQDTRLNLRTGNRATVRLGPEWAEREVSVVTPGDVGGATRTQVVHARAAGVQLEFEGTTRRGVYRVQAPGTPLPLALFSAQLDPEESELAELPAEKRRELEAFAPVIEWSAGLDLRSVLERERVGVELWMPAILAVLLLGVTETWLAQRFSRAK